MKSPRMLALVLALSTLTFSHGADAHHLAGDLQRLQDRIEKIRVSQSVPGAAVICVDRDGLLWAGFFGVSDVETQQPVTHDTMFRIGSVTKLFTAMTLVKLARRNDFGLDDSVSQHAPAESFFNEWEATHPITVAHLLEHTSGLRDWSKAEFDYNEPVSLEEGLAYSPRSRTTHWQPGRHHVYSNANYGLAGLVLEKVAGADYEDTVRREIFGPLKMVSATTLFQRASSLATGYRRDGRTPIPYWHMIQRPAAAINIKPREMSALVTMLLNEGADLLLPAEVHRIQTPQTSLAARHGLSFGYGLGLYSRYRGGFRFYEHGGDGDGYLSRLGYSPELGSGYFVVINSDNHAALGRMRRVIEAVLLRGHSAPQAQPVAMLSSRQLSQYVGRYALAAWRFEWETATPESQRALLVRRAEDGQLFSEIEGGDHSLLLPVDEFRFRRLHDSGATSGFFEENGQLYFQEDDNWVRIGDLASDQRAGDLADDTNGGRVLGDHTTATVQDNELTGKIAGGQKTGDAPDD